MNYLKLSYTNKAKRYWMSWKRHHNVQCENDDKIIDLLSSALVDANQSGQRLGHKQLHGERAETTRLKKSL